MNANELSGRVDYLVRSLHDSGTNWGGSVRFSPETADQAAELRIEDTSIGDDTFICLSGKVLDDFIDFIDFLQGHGMIGQRRLTMGGDSGLICTECRSPAGFHLAGCSHYGEPYKP